MLFPLCRTSYLERGLRGSKASRSTSNIRFGDIALGWSQSKPLCFRPCDLHDLTIRKQHLQACDQDQLSRFNIYAPFVQKLESDPDTETSSLYWDRLLSRVPSRPLLPNLRALAICPQGFINPGSRVIEYIDAFLCPTLSSIHTTQEYDIWMNPFQARDLLKRVATTCPKLAKLNILLGNSRYPENLLPFGRPCLASGLFASVSQFRDLCFLRSSSVVLYPEILQLLGNLPRLESLAAYSLNSDQDDIIDDEIPIATLALSEDSFPALRHLEIDCVPGMVVTKLWQTPPLVRNLISVRVQIMTDDTESPNDLVCTICEGSPRITDLELDLVNVEYAELSSAATEHLCRLPLLRLAIWDCNLDCRPLVLALTSLEYLNVESAYFDYEGLALMAKHMPRLQYLHAELFVMNWPEGSDLPHNSSSPSPCHIKSRFAFEEDFDVDVQSQEFSKHIDSVARCVFSALVQSWFLC